MPPCIPTFCTTRMFLNSGARGGSEDHLLERIAARTKRRKRGKPCPLWVDSSGSIMAVRMAGIGAEGPTAPAAANDRFPPLSEDREMPLGCKDLQAQRHRNKEQK